MGAALYFKTRFFLVVSWGCYIEAAQMFVRHQTIFEQEWGQKTSLAILRQYKNLSGTIQFLIESGDKKLPLLYCYMKAAHKFVRYQTIFDQEWGQKKILAILLGI